MRCIFCKKCSKNSVSVEHIIPESLENSKTILPKGVVCDKCNNYFASKIEKPVLESDEFKFLRSYQGIKNKKGKYQETKILVNGDVARARLVDGPNIEIHEDDFSKIENSLFSVKNGEIIIPITGSPPDNHHMSRFLAKMAYETFASRLIGSDDWNDYLINHEGFEPIRKFVRHPKRGEIWEFSKRKIYGEHTPHVEHQIIYEADILVIGTYEAAEYYFVVAFFGMEYAVNLAGSYIGGYERWLNENNGISPLLRKGYVT